MSDVILQPAGVQQSYEDTASVYEYGSLPDEAISSDFFWDDLDALMNCKWRVMTQKDPTSPYWEFQPMPGDDEVDDALLKEIILLDVLEQVTDEPVGLTGETHEALWVTHDFGGGLPHQVTWRLRDLPPIAHPFFVGVSLVGGTDVVVPG